MAPSPTLTSVSAAVALTPIPTPDSDSKSPKPAQFRSTHCVDGTGGDGVSGFGGWTIAFGLNAAWASLSTSQHHFRLYSCLGTFLGPANTTFPLTATVSALRDTRTFATRTILVSQPQANGSTRNVMSLTADFMKPEDGSFIKYDAGTTRKYSGPGESLSWEECESMAREWGWKDDALELFRGIYAHFRAKFEQRTPREGFAGQSARGLAPREVRLEMDERAPAEKTSAEWYRPREKYESYIDALVTVPYILDNNIAGDAADWNRINWREEAAAASSLEFALRFFVNDLDDLNDWHMRESKAVIAGEGRAFQEACLFDGRGKMIAMLSEQCVLRPKKGKARM